VSAGDDVRPGFKQRAEEALRRLSGPQREALLIKCWMSHDARWFMAVASEYGMEVANRLNQVAAREVGKAEARRVTRALGLPSVASLADYLLVQEVLISLLGPDLLDYDVVQVSDHGLQVRVQRCFANENATRAGIADQLECGVWARVGGWLDALELQYELDPALGRCLVAQGRDCAYTVNLKLTEGMVAGATTAGGS
jgi:hypothetical protein